MAVAQAVNDVSIYIMPGCGECYQLKGYLERRGAPVEIHWLTEPQNRDRLAGLMATWRGKRSAPFLAVNGELLQGFAPAAVDALLARHGVAPGAPAPATVSVAGPRAEAGLPPRALWVANFLQGSLSFLDPDTGARLAEDLFFGEGANLMGVAHDPLTDVVAVTDFGRGRVVFFHRGRGGYLHGDFDGSSVETPVNVADIVADPVRRRFYAPSTRAGVVMAFDSASGRFANGGLEGSSVDVGHAGGGLAIDVGLGRLYQRSGEFVVALDLDAFAPIRGALEASRLPLGPGRGLMVDPKTHMLYAPSLDRDELVYIDGRAFDYAFGDRAGSAVRLPGSPFVGAVDAEARKLFVSCVGSKTIEVLDADRPKVLGPRIEAGAAARGIALMPGSRLAVSEFDDGRVSVIDTRAGRYVNGERTRSGGVVEPGARGVAYVAEGGR